MFRITLAARWPVPFMAFTARRRRRARPAWNDVLGVLKVQGARLDRGYLAEWARELGLTDLLCRAVDDAGLP